jgi:hypothetical protein
MGIDELKEGHPEMGLAPFLLGHKLASVPPYSEEQNYKIII